MVGKLYQSVEETASCCGTATETPAPSQVDMVGDLVRQSKKKNNLEGWSDVLTFVMQKLSPKKQESCCMSSTNSQEST